MKLHWENDYFKSNLGSGVKNLNVLHFLWQPNPICYLSYTNMV